MTANYGGVRAQIIALAESGMSPSDIGRTLGCNLDYIRRVRQAAGLQVEERPRDTEPLYARHDDHVALAWEHGGFCALSERRGHQGNVFVCLPLVWPTQERAV